MTERYHLVTIAGEERRLRYGVAPLLDAQKVTGRSVGQLFAGLISLDLESMAALLWAAVRTETPVVKYAEAAELLQAWIDGGADLVQIQEALQEAALASGVLRARKEDEDAPKAPSRSRTGRKT